MIALYNPNRDGLKTYKKYNIEQLGNTFRSVMILKNRFGDCDVEVGMNFFGGINTFHELPKPDEIFDYERYTSPNYILNKIDNTDNESDKEDYLNNDFKFVL